MMTRTEIKILLLKRGLNQMELSRQIGIPPQTICDLLAGRRKTLKHRTAIADILGFPVEKIFGDHGN
jgi:lambda repressor-like predicted transcriptional regulator